MLHKRVTTETRSNSETKIWHLRNSTLLKVGKLKITNFKPSGLIDYKRDVEVKSDREKDLVVVGAGSAASNVVNVAHALNKDIAYFIHDKKAGDRLFGVEIIVSLSELKNLEEFEIFIALGDNYLRKKFSDEVQTRYPAAKFASLIHPSADIGPFCFIGNGSLIMPNSVVGANVKIGDFSVLGNLSCVGHDTTIGRYSSLSPGAILAGNVQLGSNSTIGMSANVLEKVRIGDNVIVGANSLLNRDVDDNKVVYGNPARVHRIRKQDDSYLR